MFPCAKCCKSKLQIHRGVTFSKNVSDPCPLLGSPHGESVEEENERKLFVCARAQAVTTLCAR